MWIFSLFLMFKPAFGANCSKYLQAFNSYDELVDGKVVEKFSVFDLTDWSRDSGFEGILLTKETPAQSQLIFEFGLGKSVQRSIQCPTEEWSLDPRFRAAKLNPKKALASLHSGFYRVKLLDQGKALCEQNFEITGE